MKARFYNRTRVSRSIPRRILREGKIHLIPLYYLLRTSCLAREAIEHSGSYLLADHIYKGEPRGRYGIGLVIDYLLLSLPSTQAFKQRYSYAKKEVLRVIKALLRVKKNIRILSVPCGIPRDFIDVCLFLRSAGLLKNTAITFLGLDLDIQALSTAKREVTRYALEPYFQFIKGDALTSGHYPKDIDMIVSTGLGEFLTAAELLKFYTIIYGALNNDGLFYTSALGKHDFSDFLLRELAEIETHYRSSLFLHSWIKTAGFRHSQTIFDSQLQHIILARK